MKIKLKPGFYKSWSFWAMLFLVLILLRDTEWIATRTPLFQYSIITSIVIMTVGLICAPFSIQHTKSQSR
ncbi:hypothetical protein [Lacticaseibacillus daqingensis]|uniref:hypothetical protein n=1 Tax=Lacticaseibacillus daqingensis TaxID=2486014 RepID=UPI000F7A29AC|nr:hypothetical protein [Lacticaseibacillus daqingensis]